MNIQDRDNKYVYAKKNTWGHSEKVTTCKPKRETSEDTKPADTWPWTFSLQNYKKIHCSCLKHPSVVFCYYSPIKLIYLHKISLSIAISQKENSPFSFSSSLKKNHWNILPKICISSYLSNGQIWQQFLKTVSETKVSNY